MYLSVYKHLKTLIWGLAVCGFISFASSHALAQNEELAATPEELDRLTQEAAASSLGEENKSRTLEAFAQAADALTRAKAWQESTTRFEAAIAEVPRLNQTLDQALAESANEIEPPDDTTPLPELEQMLSLAQADLARMRSESTELQGEPTRRSERRRVIPELLSASRGRLQEIRGLIEAPANADEPELLRNARALALKLREQNRRLEVLSYERELESYDSRNQLLPKRIALATRQVTQQEQYVAGLTSMVNAKRDVQARDAAATTRQTRFELAAYPASVRSELEALVSENARLDAIRTGPEGVLGKLRAAEGELNTLNEKLDDLRVSMGRVKERVSAAGSNAVVGLVLRKQAADLPKVRVHRRNVRNRQDEISQVQIEQIDLREQWLELIDVEVASQATSEELLALSNVADEAGFRSLVMSIIEARRNALETLINDYDSYFNRLVDINASESELIDTTQEFSDYITERVLFIRSGGLPTLETARALQDSVMWVLSPATWGQALRSMAEVYFRMPLRVSIVSLLVAFLLLARPRLKNKLADAGDAARKKSCRTFAPTVLSMVYTLGLTAPVSLILFIVGFLCSNSLAENDFDRALGGAFVVVAACAGVLVFASDMLRPKGLAISHFSFHESTSASLRKFLRACSPVLLVSLFLIVAVELLGNEDWKESLGRLAFLVGGTTSIAITSRFFRNRHNFYDAILTQTKISPSRASTLAGKISLVAIPVILLLSALYGYYYTALRIASLMAYSVLAAFCVAIACAFIYRWLLMVRRNVAHEQNKRHKESLKEQQDSADKGTYAIDEEIIDLEAVDVQNERLIRGGALAVFLVALIGIWADMVPALDILDQIKIAQTYETVPETVIDPEGNESTEYSEQPVPITLQNAFYAIVVFVITLFAARNLPGVLEMVVLQRTNMAAGERYAVKAIVQYAIVAMGLVWAFGAVGIGWSRVQWLVAALGLGLGFGLQEIFANFMSGLILLFERPIRIGDTVTVGGIHGTVSKIRIRATTITDFDRKELVVPNKEFITSQLVNWTLSDSVLRVIIPVGVSYSSDVKLVRKTLLEVARLNSIVLADPEPQAYFLGFGDNTLNFELRVHCGRFEDFIPLRHQMHMEIIDAFRKNGIEIAFPQRDLHLRSSSVPIQIVQKNTNQPDEPRAGGDQ